MVLRLLNLAVPILYKKVGRPACWKHACGVGAAWAERLRVLPETAQAPRPHLPCVSKSNGLQVVDEFSYATAVTHPQEGAPRTCRSEERV